ncbi:MAG TPA: hypothetical protein PKM48_09935 [Parvularculaceae bacterium]|nr:hypothetical protein [Parvularculaceae bacterium]
MNKLDRAIEEALDAEDRAIFSQYGEKGLFGEVGELFTGKMAPWNMIHFLVQIALFIGALYAGRQFFTIEETVPLIRWGVLTLGLFFAMAVVKMMQWQQVQANRVIREVKRVELQLARAKTV